MMCYGHSFISHVTNPNVALDVRKLGRRSIYNEYRTFSDLRSIPASKLTSQGIVRFCWLDKEKGGGEGCTIEECSACGGRVFFKATAPMRKKNGIRDKLVCINCRTGYYHPRTRR